ncbi:hypothetical protein [Sphingobacterium faecale]|uniref:Lipoprotein n=1 Tax=Sphingobacterium faecale TaxID=2803775 RepID=A0ABS1R1Z7_9SPHI|nr:hypothetical protein [Sphingobacterium faecale]MBL1408721.1 hypothetical protein [Sphingobacterium faecale]
MKKHLIYMAVLLLIAGCKKEESFEYYRKKAEEKRMEIENLIKTYACGDISDWKVDGVLGSSITTIHYYPVAPTPHAEYLRLKKEYVALVEKSRIPNDNLALIDYYYAPAIAIECIDGSPKVMTAEDYNMEKATAMLNKKLAEVEELTVQNTCNGTEEWYVVSFIKDCESIYIPVNKNDKAMSGKINELQQIIRALQMRIVALDNTQKDCYSYSNNNRSSEVVCENNKPVIKEKRM